MGIAAVLLKILIGKNDILCFAVVSIGSVAFEKLCTALTNNSLVKGIKQASPFAQTSCLEGFHSLLNQFAQNMIGYSYVGMYCRYMHSVIIIIIIIIIVIIITIIILIVIILVTNII